MSSIIVVGLNHKTAPVEVREQLAVAETELPQLLEHLRRDVALNECLVLSTCNRVEIYARAPSPDGLTSRLTQFLSARGRLDAGLLSGKLYTYTQPHSVHHLFRVTSGLDSMVLGETEITGQVKEAYEAALRSGATGKVFNTLFQKAFHAAKEVRSRTTIGRRPVSVGSVAVELARKIFGQLTTRTVLLLGAGQMAEAAVKQLRERGASQIIIVNRSIERAGSLAAACEGRVMAFEHLEEAVAQSDIVLVSTAASSYLVEPACVERLMRRRHHRPLFLVDVAVPRNVDPAVGRLTDVYLYNIDDLQHIIQANQAGRESDAAAAQAIVDRKAEQFMQWLDDPTTCLGSPTANREH